MRLPALSTIITGQVALWCIAGVSIHGWMILLYPLVWTAIGSMFLIHHMTCALPKQEQQRRMVELDKPAWRQPVAKTPHRAASSPQPAN